MTVERGRDWGSVGPAPDDLVVVRSDREAGAVLEAARREGSEPPPLGLLGGDLCRTLGGTGDEGRLRAAPTLLAVDLGVVLLDGRLRLFVAHLVLRRSWWRGRVVALMNAEHLGSWDVAPRAHPGDGHLDLLDADLSLGDRVKARRRLLTGTHLPHPGIATRRVDAWAADLDPPTTAWVDGERVRGVRKVAVPPRARRGPRRGLTGVGTGPRPGSPHRPDRTRRAGGGPYGWAMRVTGRGRRGRALGLLLALPLAVLAGAGCSPLQDVPLIVAGWDDDGTLVVGAEDCGFGTGEFDVLRVVHISETSGRRTLWELARPTTTSEPDAPSMQPPPPRPEPSSIAAVSLFSVGDPDPRQWTVVTPLAGPLPDDGRLVVEIDDEDAYETTITTRLDVPRGRAPDRYTADLDGTDVAEASGAELAEQIRDACAGDEFDGGRFWAIVGVASGVVLVVGIGIGVLTARQFRRAGRAVADRRAGPGLPGAGGVP